MSNSGDMEPEMTERARRVLAQGRIVKSLIAFGFRSDPQVGEHLAETVADPMGRKGRALAFAGADSAEAGRPCAAMARGGGALSLALGVDGGRQDGRSVRVAEGMTVWLPCEGWGRSWFGDGMRTVGDGGAFAGEHSPKGPTEAAADLARHVPP